MTNENRKSARVPTRLRCWCEGENVTVYARIGNLSEGGLFLRLTATWNPDGVSLDQLSGVEEAYLEKLLKGFGISKA